MNARLYDPALGRFLMADPVITDTLWGQGYNRYAYALGNPLKYTDPTGKSVSAVIFGIGVAVGALTSAYFTTVSMTGYYNIARWDFRKTSTWLGLFGGAAIGALGASAGFVMASAFTAIPTFTLTTVATSVIASAGSLGIQAQASADNRTAYNPSFSISFGFGSVDILSGKFRSFGSRTGLAETFGYAAGTAGVILDMTHLILGVKNVIREFDNLKNPSGAGYKGAAAKLASTEVWGKTVSQRGFEFVDIKKSFMKGNVFNLVLEKIKEKIDIKLGYYSDFHTNTDLLGSSSGSFTGSFSEDAGPVTVPQRIQNSSNGTETVISVQGGLSLL
jgi:hypothetical protein